MQYIYAIVKADYLQRTRSYSFLITLAVTVFIAYSFTPANDAGYITLSAAGFKGVYNSAWIGYVSGIMTTVMLSLYGFFLVNSGINKDIDTEVGLIIATTPVSNFKYLFCKQLSNYLVLLTIAGITFVVSIGVFFFRGTGYPFVLSNFVLPYLFFAVPALYVVAALAVASEVFLVKRTILQYIVYFFLFGACMGLINNKSELQTNGVFDPFGLGLMTKSITQHINIHYNETIKSVSFGFIFNGHRSYKLFVWEGIQWSPLFIASRFLWLLFGYAIIYLSSLYFHRFNFKQKLAIKKSNKLLNETSRKSDSSSSPGFRLASLPTLSYNYGIYPFIKTELLLLIRQGSKWLWLLNAGIWIAMCFVPFDIVYSYMLPVLLFLQVTRWSDLVTKEKTNRVHYFAYAAYKPIQRMLPAQILAGVLLAVALCLPVIVRSALLLNGFAVLNIINGAILVVLLAAFIGIATGGKKLFEIFFFMLTYAAVNKLPLTDYLGSLPHQNMSYFFFSVLTMNIVLVTSSMLMRNYQTRHA